MVLVPNLMKSLSDHLTGGRSGTDVSMDIGEITGSTTQLLISPLQKREKHQRVWVAALLAHIYTPFHHWH
jgi:hypothetical protein